jgi:uncharacterized delta-60 repeat protein
MGRSTLVLVLLITLGCGSVKGSNPDAASTIDGSTTADAAPGSAALALAKSRRWVPQTGSAQVAFTISRGSDVTGALTVHVANLPTGVTAPDVAVAAGATSGTLVFTGSVSAALGSMTPVNVVLSDATTTYSTQPFTVMVSGAPGTLDTTFGTNGRRTLPLPDPVIAATTGNALGRYVVQYPATGANAGRIVVTGELTTSGASSTTKKVAVARFNPDGTLDTSFGGGNGYVLRDYGAANVLYPAALALDSQGRIGIGATLELTACPMVVDRLSADGSTDSTFTTYNASPPGGYCGNTTGLGVIAGDSLVALGLWNNPDTSQRPLLLEVDKTGAAVNAFGGTYSVRLPNPDTDKPTLTGYQFAVDAQGRYIITGRKCEGGWNATLTACESVVARVTPDGNWDTTFGDGGAGHLGYSALTFGTTADSNTQSFWATTFDAAGNLVVGGWDEDYTTGTIARFHGNDGSLDTTFGASGRVAPVLVSGATGQQIDDVMVDEDGNIVAAGYASSGGPLVAVTRYSASGQLDTGFGNGGVGTAPSAGISPRALLQADGRIVLVGAYPRATGGYDMTLWRFWP